MILNRREQDLALIESHLHAIFWITPLKRRWILERIFPGLSATRQQLSGNYCHSMQILAWPMNPALTA
jgi:hypothetical protein